MIVKMLEKLAINYIVKRMKKSRCNNIEIVIRSDGSTVYRRNREKEQSINRTIAKIVNIDKLDTFDNKKTMK